MNLKQFIKQHLFGYKYQTIGDLAPKGFTQIGERKSINEVGEIYDRHFNELKLR